jgi:hypothetical protein
LKVTASLDVNASEKLQTAEIMLDGRKLEPNTPQGFHILRFDAPGNYELSVSTGPGAEYYSAKVIVEVIKADFGRTFSLTSGYERVWSLPGFSHQLQIESDSELYLQEIPRQPQQSRRFLANYPKDLSGNPSVVARLHEGGAIVATTKIKAFRLVTARESRDARVVGVLPDGTRVVEFSFIIDGIIPPDLSLRVELFVPDAIFANGSTTWLLDADDFDENGEARLLAYKAPGTGVAKICHRVFSFADDDPDAADAAAGMNDD